MAKNYYPSKTLETNPVDPSIILNMPIYPTPQLFNQNMNHKNKTKNRSKCLVYILAVFVILCLALLVFASVVVRIKSPVLRINSATIKSLKYDYSPSFNLTLFMTISVTNPNFGHLELTDQKNSVVSMLYGDVMMMTVVGDSKLKFKTGRVEARGEDRIDVEMEVSSYNSRDLLQSEDERGRLYSDLNSGVLELMGFSTLKGKVHLLKNKLQMSTVAVMNCTIGIDLRRQLVQKLQC